VRPRCRNVVWTKYRRWIVLKGSCAAAIIEFSGNGAVKDSDPPGSPGAEGAEPR
jgi:hypothetical protein